MDSPRRVKGLLFIGLGVGLTLLLPPSAFAQRDNGIMHVTALDPDGAPLPGVMVVAGGPVGVQTQYTGVDGTARFPGLYPGEDYEVTFVLDGFATVVREDLKIDAQQTTKIVVPMELGGVEETVHVGGDSPLVDVRSSLTATNYTDDLIDMSPTSTGLWAGVIDHIRGVVSSYRVGGAEAFTQDGSSAWGPEFNSLTYNVNGANATSRAMKPTSEGT